MVEKYQTVLFAEAARDKLKDRPQAAWKVAGMGMSQAAEGLEALPAVVKELEGIVRTPKSPAGVLPGKLAIDGAFSRKTFVEMLEAGYPVIHVASHFVLQANVELDSYLLLGDRSKLSLREMKEDEFDFRKVDLITLSACETAISAGEDHFGLEIEGFAAQVQNQGARGVLASLWRVEDESTAELMRRFYSLRTAGKLQKAEALRQAQIGVMKNREKAVWGSHRHPFFWAPFVLSGNWL